MESVVETKVCCKCKTRKAVECFSKSNRSKDGLKPECRQCRNERELRRKQENRGKIRQQQRDSYYRNHSKRLAKSRSDKTIGAILFRKYGITLEQYNGLLEQQSNKCAICKQDPFTQSTSKHQRQWKVKSKMHVDHDHATGVVRGLLCHHCNIALGSFRDDTTRLANAIEYLKHHATQK